MKALNGKTIRIAFAGGGSGGHIYPIIAVAAAIQEQASASGVDVRLHYYGDGAGGRFRKNIEGQGIKFHRILTSKLRRYLSLLNVVDAVKLPFGIIQALFKLYALMPDVVFSKGGPGAFPVVLAAWFYKIPVMIHESDVTPGLTTLLTARFARKIGISFESATKYFDPKKVVLAGNPVRRELLVGRLPKDEAKRALGFDPAKPLLLVMGGSQGARKLNEFIVLNLGSILPVAQILHQTGPDNFVETKKLAEAGLVELPASASTESRYEPVAYFADSVFGRNALSAADLVFGRAGSSTIFEAAAFGKPMILVPPGSGAADHQRENAEAVAAAGAGIVIEEANLTGRIFMAELKRLFADPAALAALGQAAANFAKPDAAVTLAAAVLALV